MSKGAIERALSQHERQDDEKLDHSQVNYEHPSRHPGKYCSGCAHYIRAHIPRCEAVKNPIRPVDWCKRWERDN
jgi:hypothetical protein